MLMIVKLWLPAVAFYAIGAVAPAIVIVLLAA